MRGLFHFSIVTLVASVRLQRHVARVLVAQGALSIPSKGWFDRVTPQSSAGLRNVIHVLSGRIFVHVTKWSMFSVVSVVELTFGVPTFPEPTQCTTQVTTHASRSTPEDKCQNDPETIFH